MKWRTEIEAMTDDAMDDFIAEQVLGLHWVGVDGRDDWGRWEGAGETKYSRPEEVGWSDSPEWSPSHVTDDAIKAAKKVGLVRDGQSFGLVWNSRLKKWMAGWGYAAGWVSHAKPARAVVNAIVEAFYAKAGGEHGTG